MKLDDLNVYQMAMHLGEEIWRQVSRWAYFEKDVVGKQWVRAADSIASNLSEGYGRYHYKENRQFCYYARGSLYETKTWLIKAVNRSLVDEDTGHGIMTDINALGVKLNNYIRSIGDTSLVREEHEEYQVQDHNPNDGDRRSPTDSERSEQNDDP